MNLYHRLENPEYLFGLLLLPVLVWLFWYMFNKKQKLIQSFGEFSIINQLMPEISYRRPIIKFGILLIALTLLILALVNPQIGSSNQITRTRGIEIMIALDVSNSMLAEDIRPNRLAKAKAALAEFVDRLQNDKVGLVVFAGEAFIQLPLTTDYNVVHSVLPAISTESVPVQGTALGSAIEACLNSFSSEDVQQKRVIILISDGEDHEERALNMAAQAAENNVIIHTLGIGNPGGATIPVRNMQGSPEIKRDEKGKPIISRLNEDILKRVAALTDGSYQHAVDLESEIQILITEIESLDKQEMVQTIYSNYEDRYPYLIFGCLLLLIIDFLIGEGKRNWLKKLKKIYR
ncbi:VWA domain-containing protein [soil metagenome]